jgi:hypothetical protein
MLGGVRAELSASYLPPADRHAQLLKIASQRPYRQRLPCLTAGVI